MIVQSIELKNQKFKVYYLTMEVDIRQNFCRIHSSKNLNVLGINDGTIYI